MKKPFLITVILIILVIFSIIILKTPTKDIVLADNEIILFYGDGCPHCKVVEEFLEKNNLNEKIKFESKEVYHNPKNANELKLIAKKCGLNDDSIRIPLLWDGSNSKCYVGDNPIIDYFKTKIN